jgi:hypothetical protein
MGPLADGFITIRLGAAYSRPYSPTAFSLRASAGDAMTDRGTGAVTDGAFDAVS